MFFNSGMRKYLIDGVRLPEGVLPSNLKAILDDGFSELRGLWLFQRELNERTCGEIESGVRDASYFEYSKNKFHVEDECDGDIFCATLLFLSAFAKKWAEQGTISCDAVVSFQIGDDVPDGAIFTFYTHREGESPVVDVQDMEGFEQPTLLMRILA